MFSQFMANTFAGILGISSAGGRVLVYGIVGAVVLAIALRTLLFVAFGVAIFRGLRTPKKA